MFVPFPQPRGMVRHYDCQLNYKLRFQISALSLSKPHPNLSLDRSLAFSASISRSRAGAWVCSETSRRRAEAVTSATARSNASALACDGLLKPESFLTNCSAEAWISSSVAGGSKLNSVLMLRHICLLLCPIRGSLSTRTVHESKTYIAGSFWHRMDAAFTPRHGRVPANQRVLHVPCHLQNCSA